MKITWELDMNLNMVMLVGIKECSVIKSNVTKLGTAATYFITHTLAMSFQNNESIKTINYISSIKKFNTCWSRYLQIQFSSRQNLNTCDASLSGWYKMQSALDKKLEIRFISEF